MAAFGASASCRCASFAAAGYKGLAILIVGGKAARIPLAPAGNDPLTGAAAAELKDEPKGAVQKRPGPAARFMESSIEFVCRLRKESNVKHPA